jgi:two-component system sensor histidine kinase HydH
MDLAVIVEQTVDLARPTIDARQICVEIDGPGTLDVTADPNLLGQALLNLLLNAADATPELGRIVIKFDGASESVGARQLQVSIQDTGPGIPPHVLDRIFNPFFTTKETGTGLGLSIVHRVVEAHDGTIVVTNPPEGGARFEIRI